MMTGVWVLESDQPEGKTQLQHLLAVGLSASDLNFLNLSFLTIQVYILKWLT